jgi:hypothetical protein
MLLASLTEESARNVERVWSAEVGGWAGGRRGDVIGGLVGGMFAHAHPHNHTHTHPHTHTTTDSLSLSLTTYCTSPRANNLCTTTIHHQGDGTCSDPSHLPTRINLRITTNPRLPPLTNTKQQTRRWRGWST